MTAVAAVLLTACEKAYDASADDIPQSEGTMQTVTIRCSGYDEAKTRATLTEAGMTDLWALVYASGNYVQTVHQTSDGSSFGTVTLTLDKGEHDVYFVASRGDGAEIDTDANTILWQTVRDTFWAGVHLSATPPASSEVEMARAATRLKITVTDEIPQNMASLVVTPDTWYTGLDFTDGTPAGEVQKAKTLNVPQTYIGTTGELTATFWGISSTQEWTTGLAIAAKDADGGVINSVAVTSAPFAANRTTVYSGRLFTAPHTATFTLADTWQADKSLTW